MATAAAASSTASLSNAFLPRLGPNGGAKSTRSLQWAKDQRQRSSPRRFGAAVITAKFELKPPPYPLVTSPCHWSKYLKS